MADFSLRALYEAIDAERQRRGLSWAQVAREMNRAEPGRSRRALSTSTIRGIQTRSVAEGDGVLQMLLWVGRTPESFVAAEYEFALSSAALPRVSHGKVLRFDTAKLFAALDAQRQSRNLTWKRVAQESAVPVSTLTHLAKGGRAAFP